MIPFGKTQNRQRHMHTMYEDESVCEPAGAKTMRTCRSDDDEQQRQLISSHPVQQEITSLSTQACIGAPIGLLVYHERIACECGIEPDSAFRTHRLIAGRMQKSLDVCNMYSRTACAGAVSQCHLRAALHMHMHARVLKALQSRCRPLLFAAASSGENHASKSLQHLRSYTCCQPAGRKDISWPLCS